MIYLDHNATTPVRPEVLDAMLPHLSGLSGNPSSIHAPGQMAREAVEKARTEIATALGCAEGELCFTSGGTEADNWALKGAVAAAVRDGSPRRKIVASAIEHHAVMHTCEYLASLGYEVEYLPVDGDGSVDIDAALSVLDEQTLLASVMHANNETGCLQPVGEIGDLARACGAIFHVDAVQSFGKVPINVDELNADLLSLSAHKINGPKGVGALYVRRGTPLEALAHGGDHESGRRAGTENVAGIVGLGTAASLRLAALANPQEDLRRLRDRLEQGIAATLNDVVVNGGPHRLDNTSNLAFTGVEAESVILGLDLEGVAVSSGSACSAGTSDPSHVLLAMGLAPRLAASCVRFSLGWGNTELEVDRCLELLPPIVRRLRHLSPAEFH